jgi:hypothetical protein
MKPFRGQGLVVLTLASASLPAPVPAQTAAPIKPYQVEWVYRVRYGYQDEWWRIFQKYQIAALDEERRRGFVRSYSVFRPIERALAGLNREIDAARAHSFGGESADR